MSRRTIPDYTPDGLARRLADMERQIADLQRVRNAPQMYVEPSVNLGTTLRQGTDVISDGLSIQTVSHGLGVIAETVVVTPRTANELIWVPSRDILTFTATRAGTTGELAFDWLAIGEEVPAPEAAVPTTNLALWLNAGDISGLSDGQSVGTWPDSSGQARHFTSDAASAPTYHTGVLNGRPVVRFSGAQWLTTGSFASSFTAIEIYIVVKIDADPPAASGNTGIWGGWATGAYPSHYPWTDGIIYEGFGSNTRYSVGNPTPSLASWNVYNVRSSATNWSAHLNGTSLYSTGSNTVSINNGTHYIGADFNRQYGLKGDVAEVVIYSDIMSTGDREAIHTYFADKYGLTIA